MFTRKFLVGVLAISLTASAGLAQAPTGAAGNQPPTHPSQDQLLKATESFVRKFFGWGPAFQLKLGPLRDSPSADFYSVPIELTIDNHTSTGDVYVSKDGKTLLRGELFDMSGDPFASNRSKLHVEGNPWRGAVDASVTVVEFADLECPTCRAAEPAVKFILDQYKVHFVFKDFPLTTIHPWAETAAIGARCAFMHSPDAFWKLHDTIFQNQDMISPDNVWDKLVQFAMDAGMDPSAFKTCMSSEEAKKAVQANEADGLALDVHSTPTFFVNGRPVMGGDVDSLRRLIEFEMAGH